MSYSFDVLKKNWTLIEHVYWFRIKKDIQVLPAAFPFLPSAVESFTINLFRQGVRTSYAYTIYLNEFKKYIFLNCQYFHLSK